MYKLRSITKRNLFNYSYIIIMAAIVIGCGGGSSSSNTTTQNNANNALDRVIKSGDIRTAPISKEDLIDATIKEIDTIKSTQKELYQAIYDNNSIEYNPTQNSQIFTKVMQSKNVIPILVGNKSKILALAGKEDGMRYLLFGSRPYDGNNQNYEHFFNKLLLWLAGDLPIDKQLKESNKTIALYSLNDKKIINYMQSNFPKWNVKECQDDLTTCINGADLLILENKNSANAKNIAQMIQKAKEKHISIAYFHSSWVQNELSNVIEKTFTVNFPYGGNWWADDKVDFNNYTKMFNHKELDSLKTLFKHMQNRDFTFEWNKCDNDDCSKINDLLEEEFYNGANYVKNSLQYFDENKKDIFLEDDYRLPKLLLLTADKIRQDIRYPMDKITTNDTQFMEAYYADYANLYYRKTAPTQPDLGNFSRSDFSNITPTTKQVSIISKVPFRATGTYAIPGKTIKITRLDTNTSIKASVFINSLRSGSTHEFRKNGYKRPKFLQSTHIPIKTGESIYITSPYGGPIEIAFDNNGADTSFKIENIGLHPFWSEFDNDPAKDSKFEQALNNDEFDWAEIVTNAFEVHSTKEKMIESIDNFRWENASKLAEATKIYASSKPMSLAGYQGVGIEQIDEVKRFADDKNITLYTADFVKHMNADQASCGYGCSGNPYDAYWSFNPISHGDIHEIGHSLEKALFRLKGWELHSSTNYYAYYTQSEYNKYIEKEGLDSKYYIKNSHVSKDVFKKQYEALQKCYTESNKTACMKSYWENSNYSPQSLFVIQAMMQTQKYATGEYTLTDGFHLLTRLHILERYLAKDAKKDWNNNKNNLCFSNYSLDEIKNINSNDWMVISLSCASGLDFRPFFNMYGEPYSQKASDQVGALGLSESTQNVFFTIAEDGGFILPSSMDKAGEFLDKKSVPVDGTTEYPY